MNRDAFEQLVDAWLTEPQRADLKARIDDAVRAEPELRRVLAEWERFDDLLRQGWPTPRGVDWSRLKVRISAAVDQGKGVEIPDDALDEMLHRLPRVDDRVQWTRFHDRIRQAVNRAGARAGTRRWLFTRLAPVGAFVAAAAGLVLALLPRGGLAPSATGVVRVTLGGPPVAAVDDGVAYVQIAAGPMPAPSPQCFFTIDPAPNAGSSGDTTGYY